MALQLIAALGFAVRIFTLGAFEMLGGHESLVGFVTARLMPISEVNSKVLMTDVVL